MGVLSAFLFVHHVPVEARKVSVLLGLESETILSYHMGAGNLTQVFCKMLLTAEPCIQPRDTCIKDTISILLSL